MRIVAMSLAKVVAAGLIVLNMFAFLGTQTMAGGAGEASFGLMVNATVSHSNDVRMADELGPVPACSNEMIAGMSSNAGQPCNDHDALCACCGSNCVSLMGSAVLPLAVALLPPAHTHAAWMAISLPPDGLAAPPGERPPRLI